MGQVWKPLLKGTYCSNQKLAYLVKVGFNFHDLHQTQKDSKVYIFPELLMQKFQPLRSPFSCYKQLFVFMLCSTFICKQMGLQST